jgi:hypothetical protein
LAKRNENVVAIVLEHIDVGREFIEWPLHITIVPWFHGYDAKKLDDLLAGLAASFTPFRAKAGPIEKFGPKKDVTVNVIDDSKELKELHQAVFYTLETNDFIIHQKDFVGDGYMAHVTHQTHAFLKEGAQITIKSFSLIEQERLKKTGEIVKKIVKEYELG